jgi:hypothetical protein
MSGTSDTGQGTQEIGGCVPRGHCNREIRERGKRRGEGADRAYLISYHIISYPEDELQEESSCKEMASCLLIYFLILSTKNDMFNAGSPHSYVLVLCLAQDVTVLNGGSESQSKATSSRQVLNS